MWIGMGNCVKPFLSIFRWIYDVDIETATLCPTTERHSYFTPNRFTKDEAYHQVLTSKKFHSISASSKLVLRQFSFSLKSKKRSSEINTPNNTEMNWFYIPYTLWITHTNRFIRSNDIGCVQSIGSFRSREHSEYAWVDHFWMTKIVKEINLHLKCNIMHIKSHTAL